MLVLFWYVISFSIYKTVNSWFLSLLLFFFQIFMCDTVLLIYVGLKGIENFIKIILPSTMIVAKKLQHLQNHLPWASALCLMFHFHQFQNKNHKLLLYDKLYVVAYCYIFCLQYNVAFWYQK